MKKLLLSLIATISISACPFCGGGTSLEAANTYLAITIFLSSFPIIMASAALLLYKRYKSKLQELTNSGAKHKL